MSPPPWMYLGEADPSGAPDSGSHYSPESSDGSAEGAQLLSTFWS